MGNQEEGKQDTVTDYKHRVVAWWTSRRSGLAKSDSVPNALHFAAPPQFGGLEGRWTPEDLLLTALASCYTTTFRVLADHSQFPYADLEVEVLGLVRKVDSGYSFTEIVTIPSLTIFHSDHEAHGRALLQKAQASCLVARTICAPHKLEPRIQLRETKRPRWLDE